MMPGAFGIMTGVCHLAAGLPYLLLPILGSIETVVPSGL